MSQAHRWLILALTIGLAAHTWGMEEARTRVFSSPQAESLVRVDVGWDGDTRSVATATVLRFNASKYAYEKLSSFKLGSVWPPHLVVLSDEAGFIVVFNDVETLTKGRDALVIYRPDGSVDKRWGLEEILKLLGKADLAFAPGIQWQTGAVLRGNERGGVVLIQLLQDPSAPLAPLRMLRIELPSFEMTAYPPRESPKAPTK